MFRYPPSFCSFLHDLCATLGHEVGFVDQKEFNTPEKVRTLVFAGRSLCIGMKHEYSLIRVGSGEPTEVFPVGRNKRPVAVSLMCH